MLASKCLPHDTRITTCPPGSLVSGEGLPIIVPSVMRSGTHLVLDTLFNNFPILRRSPLFVDFDAYERAELPAGQLTSLAGVCIKTHFPHTPLAEPYASVLATLASRALIVTPRRPATEIRRSLARWGQEVSAAEIAEIQNRFNNFWKPFSPLTVDFSTLLDPAGIEVLIRQVAERTGLKPHPRSRPVMPARIRPGIFFDKALTRVLGRRSPRINTTIGANLSRRSFS